MHYTKFFWNAKKCVNPGTKIKLQKYNFTIQCYKNKILFCLLKINVKD